jgi:hypothetical protein
MEQLGCRVCSFEWKYVGERARSHVIVVQDGDGEELGLGM